DVCAIGGCVHRVSDSPIVSFARDGEVFELGRSGQDPVLHLHGSTGLGLAPVSIASSERLAGDGSIVRGVRYDSREVFIPLYVEAPSTGELSAVRRDLTALLAPHRGPVEVRIEDPATGSVRMIRGYLREGLDGDFGDGFHGFWQTLGLTFECPDPWWLGPERLVSLQVNPGSKPFLSAYKYSRRNLAVNPSFESGLGQGNLGPFWSKNGQGELDTAWAASGDHSVRIDPVPGGTTDSTFYPWGNSATAVAEALGLTPGTTVTIGATIHLEAAQTGTLNTHARCIRVNRYNGTSTQFSWALSDPAPNEPGDHRVSITFEVPA